MKITIDLYPDVMTDVQREAMNVLLFSAPHKTDTGRQEPKTPADTEDATDYDPAARIYGEKGEKARRTKEEMAQDAAIAERWAALWPNKDVPAKPVGDLEAKLDEVEAREAEREKEEEEDDSFDIDVEDDALDLEDFRAIIVKHSKALGGKRLAEIMAPHKNPAAVPEAERRDYADKIIEAAADAS